MPEGVFFTLKDPSVLLSDKNGQIWLPLAECPKGVNLGTVAAAGMFFDVVGMSKKRSALLLKPIVIGGAAKNLEEEIEEWRKARDAEQ